MLNKMNKKILDLALLKMGKLSIFIMINLGVFRSDICFAQWIKVHETPRMIIFMDVPSLASPIENRVFDVLTDFRQPDSSNDELVSMINRVEFFCEKHLRRTLKATHYAQNMGQGVPTYEMSDPDGWKPVKDHDGWDPVMRIVCNALTFSP